MNIYRLLGHTLGSYFKFVHWTSRQIVDVSVEQVEDNLPAIFTMWHGEHFMVPLAWPKGYPVRILVSRNNDGEIQAGAVEAFGLKMVRGSGGRNRAKTLKKGGIRGTLELLTALEEGESVALTANVPRGPARRVGMGAVALAKHSGRPIYPVCYLTSRGIKLNSWDKAIINLPFSKAAIALGEPVWVSAKCSDEEMEEARLTVERRLAEITGTARAKLG